LARWRKSNFVFLSLDQFPHLTDEEKSAMKARALEAELDYLAMLESLGGPRCDAEAALIRAFARFRGDKLPSFHELQARRIKKAEAEQKRRKSKKRK
jgi:hypothetical protein